MSSLREFWIELAYNQITDVSPFEIIEGLYNLEQFRLNFRLLFY